MKNIHPVSGAGIRTHNLLIMSLLPWPLDQGSIFTNRRRYKAYLVYTVIVEQFLKEKLLRDFLTLLKDKRHLIATFLLALTCLHWYLLSKVYTQGIAFISLQILDQFKQIN